MSWFTILKVIGHSQRGNGELVKNGKLIMENAGTFSQGRIAGFVGRRSYPSPVAPLQCCTRLLKMEVGIIASPPRPHGALPLCGQRIKDNKLATVTRGLTEAI